MPGPFDWLGSLFSSPEATLQTAPNIPPTLPGAPGYSPQSSLGGLLDPAGIRQQAAWSGLGALSAGLLAAGQRRPAASPSLLPQAFGAFQPAYAASIQSGGQMAALEQQARDQQLLNQARASNPAYRNLPTAALVAQLSRPYARDMTPAEIAAAGLTPGLPWQRSATGEFSVPAHDPRVMQVGAGAEATGRAQAVGTVVPQVGLYVMPGSPAAAAYGIGGTGTTPVPVPGVAPPVAAGARPSPAPGPGPGGARPQTAMPPAQADRFVAETGGDPLAYVGGPHDPYRGWEPGQPDLPVIAPPPPTVAPPRTAAPSPRRTPAPAAVPPAPPPAPVAEAVKPPGLPPAPLPVQSPFPSVASDPRANIQPFGTAGGALIGPPSPVAVQREQAITTARIRNAEEVQAPQVRASVSLLQSVDTMRRNVLNDPAMRFGPGGGALNFAATWLRSIGANDIAERIQSPGFAAARGEASAMLLAAIGGSLGPGISNTDRAEIARQVPDPLQDRESFERFLTAIQQRASNNLVQSHAAYGAAMPGYSPASDPLTVGTARTLQNIGIDPNILVKDPSRGIPRPPYMTREPPAATPPSAATPPAATPPTQRPAAAPVAPPRTASGDFDIQALNRASPGTPYRFPDGNDYEYLPADLNASPPRRAATFRRVSP